MHITFYSDNAMTSILCIICTVLLFGISDKKQTWILVIVLWKAREHHRSDSSQHATLQQWTLMTSRPKPKTLRSLRGRGAFRLLS